MSIALVMPPDIETDEHINRCLQCIQWHHAITGDVTIFAPNSLFEYYQKSLQPREVVRYSPAAVGHFETLILMSGTRTAATIAPVSNFHNDRVYRLTENGRLVLKNPGVDETEYPHNDRHIFNRLSKRDGEQTLTYFPFGSYAIATGSGPLDDFGFRERDDIGELATRASNHKVIVVLGGSTVWSQDAQIEETFCFQLEKRLRAHCAETESDRQVTVLNFGMHSHVVLNEIITYILFVDHIHPDCVIAHDGVNDFAYGLLTDPYLLNVHAMTYNYPQEGWAQILQGSEGQTNQPGAELKQHSLPPAVIRSYIRRKLQLHDIVTSRGADFIWTLQPWAGSKSEMSFREKERFKNRDSKKSYRVVWERLPYLYELISAVTLPERVTQLNAHECFGWFGAEKTLFTDHCHTTPAGDREIAEMYFDYLIRNGIVD